MELVGMRGKLKNGIPTEGLMIVVGNPKSGKTTFSASFPDSYVLELEPGGGDRVGGRIHDVKNLAEFREVFKAVVAEPKIKTVVVDTIDQLNCWYEDEVAQKFNLSNITERKAGVDGFQVWGEHRTKIETLVGFLKACGKLVILTAHCREAKTDDSGNIVTPMGINMPGKSGGYLAAQADIIGYAYKKQLGSGTKYFLSFQGGPLGTWGSRVDELNDKVLELPRNSPYSAFEAVFVGQGQAAEKTPLKRTLEAAGGVK